MSLKGEAGKRYVYTARSGKPQGKRVNTEV